MNYYSQIIHELIDVQVRHPDKHGKHLLFYLNI